MNGVGACPILERFTAIYHALNAQRGWLADASSLRFSAIAAVMSPGEAVDVAETIRAMAERLKKSSGWFGEWSSPVRFVVAAFLAAHEDTVEAFLEEVVRVRAMLRERKVRKGGLYEAMAVLLLRSRAALAPVDEAMVDRVVALYGEMKKYHWWLTGADDLAACALLAGQAGEIEQVGRRAEAVYQALHKTLWASNPLQVAANVLCLSHLEAEAVAQRFRGLVSVFEKHGMRIYQEDYDEMALLALLEADADGLAHRILDVTPRLEALKPEPGPALAFNLACQVVFLERSACTEAPPEVTGLKALLDMQGLLHAQRVITLAAAGLIVAI